MKLGTLARTTGITLVVLLGVAGFVSGATHRFFDYDEIYHAHATWLIAHGDRPFHDFQGSHLPFLWYPLAVAWRVLPDSPTTLLPLRFVAGLGTLLWVVGIAACLTAVRREIPLRWVIVGFAAVAFYQSVIDYALEFRPDSWSNALLFFALFLVLTQRPASVAKRYAIFGFLATLAVLASPKLFLLPAIFAVIDCDDHLRRRDHPGAVVVGYTIGVGAALLVGIAFLAIARVNPILAFDMSIEYQLAFESHNSFGLGLMESVLRQPLLVYLILGGGFAWADYLLRVGRRASPYEIAVFMFLFVEIETVDRPYKQYYAPWFLVAATFVPFAGLFVEQTFKRVAPWCFAAAIALSGWSAWNTLRLFSQENQAADMLAFYDTLVRLSPADAAIVAYPPFHPVVRRDVFYAWSRTTDPGGYTTEPIMRALEIPGYSERFEPAYYRQQLDTTPPVVVVSPVKGDSGYEPLQWATLREYLAAERFKYALVDEGLLRPVWLRRGDIRRHALEQQPPAVQPLYE